MPDATANAECLIRVSQPSMRLSYRSDVSELLPERCCANFKFCDRVAALKRRHDPTNFFRMNHNIELAARPAVAVT